MPYDPALPADATKAVAAQMRAQFHGLFDLIQAIPAGPAGPPGAIGPQGPQGIPGPAFTGAQAGAVNTLPAGADATVSLFFDGVSLVFHFGIPRGDTGAAGPMGPQGPAIASGIVDSVTSLNPGENPTVSVSFDGTTMHFSFGIPRGNDGSPGTAGPQGMPGEVSYAALALAIAGTSANTNAVATLDTPFANDPPTLADMETLRAKFNEMIVAARR